MVRTPTRAAASLVAALALTTVLPRPAAGQEAHGWVFYAHNDFPVALAAVHLVRPDGTVAATTESGFDGRFVLRAPEPGEYMIHVEHLTAYSMIGEPVELGEEARVILTFSVVPKPLALEAIEVEVERRSLPLAEQGFYDRERIGLGHFIGPERLERRAAFRTSDLLRAVPGVRILQSSGIAGLGSYPVMRAGVRSGLRVDGPPCFPRIYLDGVVVEQGGRQWPFSDFDALVAPSDLEGMEVYRSQVEMPAQYSGLSACGAILLWTKRGR